MIEVLVISISNPLLVGVYENFELKEEIKLEGMTSEVLPICFENLLEKYKIEKISYVNTPGSYMAIKVAYVFLKTICITKNIEFFACSGFEFNENSPIKALGKKYFINKKNAVKVDFLDKNTKIADFKLPKILFDIKFNKDTLPIYNLPAI